jgi:hypothetical protein
MTTMSRSTPTRIVQTMHRLGMTIQTMQMSLPMNARQSPLAVRSLRRRPSGFDLKSKQKRTGVTHV